MIYTDEQHDIMAHEAMKALSSFMANEEFDKVPATFKNYVWAGIAMMQGKEPQNKLDDKMKKLIDQGGY